jgi:hypothetical protein
MRIIEVTKDDAVHMADLLALVTHTNKLIDAMKVAGIQMQGRAVERKETTFAWIKDIATGMANELTAKSAPAAAKSTPTTPPTSPVKSTKKSSRSTRAK